MGRSYVLPSAIVLVLLLEAAMEVPAASDNMICDMKELSSACEEAKKTGDPDAGCCAMLKKHEPCLCQYMKDPVVRAFVNTHKGRHIYAICKEPLPSCPQLAPTP